MGFGSALYPAIGGPGEGSNRYQQVVAWTL